MIMNHTIKNKHKEDQTMPILRINEVTVCSYSMDDALTLLAKAKINIDQPTVKEIMCMWCCAYLKQRIYRKKLFLKQLTYFLFFIFLYLY